MAAGERLAVGPFAQHGLDESFGFAVGAGPVRAGAEVVDPEPFDRGGVDFGAVAGAVVGHDALHVDAMLGEPGDRSFQERDAGGAFLVGEDLDVGEAAGVVDRDVDVLPAGLVGAPVALAAAGDSMTGTFEPAELLDVDVDQLAGVAAAVPVRWFRWLEPRQPVQPEAAQHRAHRRRRHVQLGRDPRARPPQPTQLFDHRDRRIRGAVRDAMRRRRPVRHRVAGPPPRQPAITGPFRTARRVGRILDGPAFIDDTTAHQIAHVRRQLGVTVQLHGSP